MYGTTIKIVTAYMLGYIFLRLLKSATKSQTTTGLEFGITTSNATSCVRVLTIKYRNTLNKQTHSTLFLNHLLCIVSGINQFNFNTVQSVLCKALVLLQRK